MKENIPVNKQQAYALAQVFWSQQEFAKAEQWALEAMKLGSKELAPKLLAEIAINTKSKSTAITLCSYYWENDNPQQALHWAYKAKEFGSQQLAGKRIAEITAYLDAINIHNEVNGMTYINTK